MLLLLLLLHLSLPLPTILCCCCCRLCYVWQVDAESLLSLQTLTGAALSLTPAAAAAAAAAAWRSSRSSSLYARRDSFFSSPVGDELLQHGMYEASQLYVHLLLNSPSPRCILGAEGRGFAAMGVSNSSSSSSSIGDDLQAAEFLQDGRLVVAAVSCPSPYPLGIYETQRGHLLAAFAATAVLIPSRQSSNSSSSRDEGTGVLLCSFPALALDRSRPPVAAAAAAAAFPAAAAAGNAAAAAAKGRWLAAASDVGGCIAMAYIGDEKLVELQRHFDSCSKQQQQKAAAARAAADQRVVVVPQVLPLQAFYINERAAIVSHPMHACKDVAAEFCMHACMRNCMHARMRLLLVLSLVYLQATSLVWRPRRRAAAPGGSSSIHLLLGCSDGFIRVCAFVPQAPLQLQLQQQQQQQVQVYPQLRLKSVTLARIASGIQTGNDALLLQLSLHLLLLFLALRLLLPLLPLCLVTCCCCCICAAASVCDLVYVHLNHRRVVLLASCNATDLPSDSTGFFTAAAGGESNGDSSSSSNSSNWGLYEVRAAEQTQDGIETVTEVVQRHPEFIVGLAASPTAATVISLSADGNLIVRARKDLAAAAAAAAVASTAATSQVSSPAADASQKQQAAVSTVSSPAPAAAVADAAAPAATPEAAAATAAASTPAAVSEADRPRKRQHLSEEEQQLAAAGDSAAAAADTTTATETAAAAGTATAGDIDAAAAAADTEVSGDTAAAASAALLTADTAEAATEAAGDTAPAAGDAAEALEADEDLFGET